MRLRHAARALLEMGVVEEYQVLDTPYEIWEWLKHRGPVAASIYWDELMTNHRGALREIPVTSTTWVNSGAHAITILGWSPSEQAFYFTPNLGTGWGSKGFALLRESDFPHVFVNGVGFVHENVPAADLPDPDSCEPDTYVPYHYREPGDPDPALSRAKLLEEALKAATEAEKAVTSAAVNVGSADPGVAPPLALPKNPLAAAEPCTPAGDDCEPNQPATLSSGGSAVKEAISRGSRNSAGNPVVLDRPVGFKANLRARGDLRPRIGKR